MLIDWFTVGAQIVNFLVLVWLLRRYLYRPVLAAIDAREQELAARRDAAAADRARATKEREEWQNRRRLLECGTSSAWFAACRQRMSCRSRCSPQS